MEEFDEMKMDDDEELDEAGSGELGGEDLGDDDDLTADDM